MDIVVWLFTIGYLFQLGGSSLLIYKISKQKSIYGLSIDTQYILCLANLSRCVWIFYTRLSFLPLANIEVFVNTFLSIGCCYLCLKYKDETGYSTSKYLDVKILTVVCAILSFIFHPGMKNEYFLTVQMLVSFSIFMESAALLPQFIIMKKAQEVEVLTSHYIMILMVSRACRLCFWIKMYFENNYFIELIVADFIHSIFLADFAYEYFKSMKSGKRILLG